MSYTIALIQCEVRNEIKENLKTAEYYTKKARQAGACLAVFPEYFMLSNLIFPEDYVNQSQTIPGPFVDAMAALAVRYNLWILFGMNERAVTNPKKSYNTLVLLDDRGNIQGTYRKTHLFDAFHWKESDSTLPGDGFFVPVQTPFGILGLGTCYDLRFPELARYEALHKAEILIYPAAWVKGNLKDIQWKFLLAARAIENGIYVMGCSQYTKDTYLGQSCAFDPFGQILAEGSNKEEMLLVATAAEHAKEAQKIIPALATRRRDLYKLF